MSTALPILPRQEAQRLALDTLVCCVACRIKLVMTDVDPLVSLETALSAREYGRTTQDVLDLCALAARIQEALSRQDVVLLLERSKTSKQIWSRLCSIGKDERLWRFVDHLPANYSSLYLISSMTDDQLSDGFDMGDISASATTRQISDFLRKWSLLHQTYGLNGDVRICHLASERELDDGEVQGILEEINKEAIRFGVILMDGKSRFSRFGKKQQMIMEQEEKAFEAETAVEHLMYLSSEDFRSHFSLEEVDDLMEGDFASFAAALLSISRSRREMMDKHGKPYCYKIALEYLRSESRTQRYNYKRRLMHVRAKYPALKDVVDQIFTEFVAPLPAS